MKKLFASTGRVLLTLVSLVVAVAVGWQLWSYYMLEPWTRDGRVRADVVTVAADVAGLISDVFVHDNQKVTKGSHCFRIDSGAFNMCSIRRKPMLPADRLHSIRPNAISNAQEPDQRRGYRSAGRAAAAGGRRRSGGLDAANAALEIARLNLERSTVLAPVNGIVTNFDLLPGRYVNAGTAVFALLGSDTFRVEGYFEETKLRRIRIGEECDRKADRRSAPAVGARREHRLRYRRPEPQHQQQPVGLRQSNLQLGAPRAAHPSAYQARQCAAGPSSRRRPHATVSIGKISW